MWWFIYSCICAFGSAVFYSNRARSQARQLQAGRLRCCCFFIYMLKLNVFNHLNKRKIQHSCSQKRQQLFKHMAVCISVEFRNFDGQKVHLSKIWQEKKNQCPLWTLWRGLFLLLWAINPEHKLIPVSSVTSGDAQEPAVLHWKVWKLTRGRIQDMQRTPLNLIVSFVEIIVKRLWLMPQTLRK